MEGTAALAGCAPKTHVLHASKGRARVAQKRERGAGVFEEADAHGVVGLFPQEVLRRKIMPLCEHLEELKRVARVGVGLAVVVCHEDEAVRCVLVSFLDDLDGVVNAGPNVQEKLVVVVLVLHEPEHLVLHGQVAWNKMVRRVYSRRSATK